jgi:hypothetical protein
MPVSKKPFTQNQLAKMHARVGVARVFGPQNLLPDESHAQVAGLLKTLEARGLIVHVDGHGWVDTHTAIERYTEYTGIKELLATNAKRSVIDQFGNPQPVATGDEEYGRCSEDVVCKNSCFYEFNGLRDDPTCVRCGLTAAEKDAL